MSDSTIDVYARAVRRIGQYYDCCPDRLTSEQLEVYFAELVQSHSWSIVKVDRNGLQFTCNLEYLSSDGAGCTRLRRRCHHRPGAYDDHMALKTGFSSIGPTRYR